jgi:presenilin 1
MGSSVLDQLGAEILSIIAPVSICMLLVVLLVHTLVPHGGQAPATSIAMLVYDEQVTDSFSQKLGGALLNALVFVAIVTVVTFILVALFYFRCNRVLKGYMGFSAFMVLAYMGGGLAIQLIQYFSIPIDVITFSFLLYNFATVGVMAVFFCKMPIVFTQGYLVLIGVLVAFWFTMLPEWTTWMLLLAMALYDVFAVLVPGGPLNMLVELAIARDEDIPALVYEARPITRQVSIPTAAPEVATLRPPQTVQRQRWRRQASTRGTSESNFTAAGGSLTELGPAPAGGQSQRHNEHNSESGQGQIEGLTPPASSMPVSNNDESILPVSTTPAAPVDEETVALVSSHAQALTATQSAIAMDGLEAGTRRTQGGVDIEQILDNVVGDGQGGVLSGAIKLGLGDFIFYSVLVGRAAMYDMMTVYACYLAIVSGLGATLLLLAIWRRALPALPISIALGVLFYFLTRLLLDPFVANLTTHFLFF